MGSSLLRAAAALTVITLLPAAALSFSMQARAMPGPMSMAPLDSGGTPLHGTAGLDAPTVDALLRGWESGLFGSFGYNGTTADGSFVQLVFTPSKGMISSYLAKRGTETLAIVESISVVPSTEFAEPYVNGPVFTAMSPWLTITAHDDSAGQLEFRTGAEPRTIVFQLNSLLADVTDRSTSMGWPEATLSFAVGESRGRLLLGAGTFNVTGATVIASMTANDLLVMRIMPGFVSDRPQPSAILDAFGSGRLAAEFALVARSDGGWIENSFRYRLELVASPTMVQPCHASLGISSPTDREGLVLLAFDPMTMPADPAHALVVKTNGSEIPEAPDVLGVFYASPNGQTGPFYSRSTPNATVLAVYLPSLRSVTIDVTSVPVVQPASDWTTEAAMVLALGVVSVAAAVMFRRERT